MFSKVVVCIPAVTFTAINCLCTLIMSFISSRMVKLCQSPFMNAVAAPCKYGSTLLSQLAVSAPDDAFALDEKASVTKSSVV